MEHTNITSAKRGKNLLLTLTTLSLGVLMMGFGQIVTQPSLVSKVHAAKPTPVPTATPTHSPTITPPSKTIEGYYISWGTYRRDYQVMEVPGEKLTHLYYAFSNTDASKCVLGDEFADINKAFDGDSTAATAPRGNFNQLLKFKQKYPHVKIILAIGGWSFSDYFSDLALTPQSRENFVRSCIDMYIKGNYVRTSTNPPTNISIPNVFDGLNVDWEYPVSDGEAGNIERPEDKQNFTLLLQEFRRQLDVQGTTDGKRYLLTTDIIGDPEKLDAHYEISLIHQYLDAIHLMTIEYNGQWDWVTPRTGFQSPIYPDPAHPITSQGANSNIHAAVNGMINRGTPASKIIVGVPWYGKIYGNVPNVNNGLYQLWGSAPRGTWGVGGNMDYWDIKQNYLSRYTKYYNPTAKAEWLWNGSTFVDYSGGPLAATEKAQYVKTNNLPGVWIWELSMDDKASDDLINALYTELK